MLGPHHRLTGYIIYDYSLSLHSHSLAFSPVLGGFITPTHWV